MAARGRPLPCWGGAGEGNGSCFAYAQVGSSAMDCDGEVNESGESCICTPNAVVACYSGPPGTEDVGACQAGTMTCDEVGLGLSACNGEIAPQCEDCKTDTDCDGLPCDGHRTWAATWGLEANDGAADVVVDPNDGSIVMAGYFIPTIVNQVTMPLNFGGSSLPLAPPYNAKRAAFVVKLDAQHQVLWAKEFHGSGDVEATSLALSGDQIWVTGLP